MHAVVIEKYGNPSVLQLKEIPNLEPNRGEVRVKIHASALNRADIEQRKGKYPPPIPSEYEIPGLEFAGVVDKLGAEVRNAHHYIESNSNFGKVILTITSQEKGE